MSSENQIIGNQGIYAQTRSFSEGGYGNYPAGYQGIENYPVPYQGGGFPGTSAGAGSGSSSFNMNQIKQIVDRMGGIDGILATMNKVQKVVQNLQQMAPMFKLIMGSFGKAKTTDSNLDKYSLRKRRRRRRRSGGSKGRR